ncbi:glycosyltransferase [Frankia sp. Cr2]|uniref:glycosyltransferase n=1 Tax=Frankia sp. Cr2 TaxID=3073932 RepID=UPI002AD57FB3|nr:glycosyltransferase [Frankia sp. Cr2]
MRILVYPHMMEIGGSQLNAVELAGAVRDLGHEVTVFGVPGPLVDTVGDLKLDYVASPKPGRRPSPRVMSALCQVVRERRIDLVHGYEWPPALEAFVGPRTRLGVPAFATVMSMAVAPFLPATMPLVVGTELIGESARAARRGPVDLIEPPVDVRLNAPDAVSDVALTELRTRFDLDPADLHVVVVSRLATELKLEGLLAAVDAVARLAVDMPVRLVVVGDGPARDQLAAHVARVGAVRGRQVVVLTGELTDPRPAYALADISIGMGGSALRASAFAKPLVVQGEGGFFELLTPDSVATFLWQGWYGIGTGDRTSGARRLVTILRPLLADADRRRELGDYGRELVTQRFSLERAARVQEALYTRTLATGAGRPDVRTLGVSAAGLFAHEVRRHYDQLRGQAALDDFNARRVQPGNPQARGGPAKSAAVVSASGQPLSDPAAPGSAGLPSHPIEGTLR